MKRDKAFFKNIFDSSNYLINSISRDETANKSNSYTKHGMNGVTIFKNSNSNLIGNSSSNYYNNKEVDRIKKDIKSMREARHTEGYVSRPVWNLQHKMVADDFEFYIENKDDKNYKAKVKRMKRYFYQILKNSGYIKNVFFDELAHNIHYSNIFIHKKNDYVLGKTIALTIMPSSGWKPHKRMGFNVKEWCFTPSRDSNIQFSNGYKLFSYKNVIHLTINKESDDMFGIPFLKPTLDDASLLRDVENADAANFIDSTDQKPYITVGDDNTGAKQSEIEETKFNLAQTEEDEIPVFSGRVKINANVIERIDGSNTISSLKNRLVASAGSSKTSMGESSSGRQTAEADSESEDQTVESLQRLLSNQLNQKLFMQLNYELFGDDLLEEDMVFIKAKENFNKQERREKHDLLMWTSGGLDKDGYEKRSRTKLNEKKTFQNLMGGKSDNVDGQVAQKTDPQNQHGKRGTSKKSKKD